MLPRIEGERVALDKIVRLCGGVSEEGFEFPVAPEDIGGSFEESEESAEDVGGTEVEFAIESAFPLDRLRSALGVLEVTLEWEQVPFYLRTRVLEEGCAWPELKHSYDYVVEMEAPGEFYTEGDVLIGFDGGADDKEGGDLDASFSDVVNLLLDLLDRIAFAVEVEYALRATLNPGVDALATGGFHKSEEFSVDSVGSGEAGPANFEFVVEDELADSLRAREVSREGVVEEANVPDSVLLNDFGEFPDYIFWRAHNEFGTELLDAVSA